MEPKEVPCRHCWACRKLKEDALTGRVLLEASQHEWIDVLTLTYSDREARAAIASGEPDPRVNINKGHFQKLMMKLRVAQTRKAQKLGANVSSAMKYLVAGEYGAKKGRVHFHCLLMGTGPRPKMPEYYTEQQSWKPWKYGFTYVEPCQDFKAVRYVAKYSTKEAWEAAKGTQAVKEKTWISYSRIPVMGAQAVRSMARAQAQAGIPPVDLAYIPFGGDPKARYVMNGALEIEFWDELLTLKPEWRPAWRNDVPLTEAAYKSRKRFIRAEALKEGVSEDMIDLVHPPKRLYVPMEIRHDNFFEVAKWREDLVKDAMELGEAHGVAPEQNHATVAWVRSAVQCVPLKERYELLLRLKRLWRDMSTHQRLRMLSGASGRSPGQCG